MPNSRACVACLLVLLAAGHSSPSSSQLLTDSRAFGGEETYALPQHVLCAFVFDLNHDSWPDVVSVEPDGQGSWVTSWHNDRHGRLIMARRDPFPFLVAGAAGADFDADGNLDLALTVPSTSGSQIVVVQGAVSGGFSEDGTYAELTYASLIRAGDLDNDGVPDLVVAGDSLVISYRGSGDGTFARRSAVAAPWVEWPYPRALHLADLDRDSHLDAIYSPGSSWTPSDLAIFRGVGDGTFHPVSAGVVPSDVPAIPFDGDGDGWVDLCMAWGQPQMYWNRGTGSMDFEAGALPRPVDDLDLLATDGDGDGGIDIFVRRDASPGRIGSLRSRGPRKFEAAPEIVLNGYDYRDEVRLLAAADMDRDGYPDLIAHRSTRGLTVLRHATRDAFRGLHRYETPYNNVFSNKRRLFPARLQNLGVEMLEPRTEGGFQYWWFDYRQRLQGPVPILGIDDVLEYVADFDGDGTSDVLRSRETSLVFATGSFGPRFDVRAAWANSRFMTTGDFDGNGRPDIAVLTSQNSVNLLLNQGSRTFSEQATNLRVTSQWDACGAGDMNGDGRDDLVFHIRPEDWHLPDTCAVVPYEGGGFGTPRLLPYTIHDGSHGGCAGLQVVLPDLDGDGDRDVALLNRCGGLNARIPLFENQGGFLLSHRTTLFGSESPSNLVAHDFDRDGRVDLALGDIPEGYMATLRMFYGGAGWTEWMKTMRHITCGGVYGLVAADINRDKKMDLVMNTSGCSMTSAMYVIFNTSPDSVSHTHLSLGEAGGQGRMVAESRLPGEGLAIQSVTPNPSRGSFAIRLARPSMTNVRVDLYDLAGRRVFRQDVQPAGSSETVLLSPPQQLAAGVYLLRLTEGGRQATARVALIR